MRSALAIQCDHLALLASREQWQSLPFIGMSGDPHGYFEMRRCPGCSLILERSLATPWPITPTDAANAIWQEAQRRGDERCGCSHERRSHIDNVAACLSGACPCCRFSPTPPNPSFPTKG